MQCLAVLLSAITTDLAIARRRLFKDFFSARFAQLHKAEVSRAG
jgi:hypothetical protein